MLFNWLVFLIFPVLLALPGPPAAAAGDAATWAVDPPKRPPWLGPAGAPGALDCSGAPTIVLSPGLADTLTGDTTGGPSLNAAYSCVSWDESGPELVFRLETTAPVRLRVDLASAVDLDVFLLAACDGGSCLMAGNASLTAELPPGEAFLVVDGYRGAAGPFELRLSGVEAGLPPAVCDPASGVATAVSCPGTYEGTVFSRPNLVDSDPGCGSLEAATGGEAWFAITVPPRVTLSASVTVGTFDAVLWVYGSCGPEAACLAWADAELVGTRETVEYENDSREPRTVWLAVDSFRPLPAGADLELRSFFALQLSCTGGVPVESPSLGGLKGLYR